MKEPAISQHVQHLFFLNLVGETCKENTLYERILSYFNRINMAFGGDEEF